MKSLEKLDRIKSATVLTVCFVALILSASTIVGPASASLPGDPTPSLYQHILEDGFVSWCDENKIKIREQMSTDEVQALFMRFLGEEPMYASTLQEWDRLSNLETTSVEEVIPVVDVETVVQYGQVVDEWSETQTVNGTEYTYVMTEYAYDGSDVVKVTVYASDGSVVTDPNIYVVIIPIKIWVLWWQVQVGEDAFLYEFFTATNYEALRFKTNLINTLYANLAITAAVCLVASIAGAPIVGLVAIYMGAYTSIAVNIINAAYSTWGNRFYIVLMNHFMYTLIGCAFAMWTVWADYSVHYIWPDPLSGGMYMLNPFSAINAQLQSNAMHSIGNRYGFNRWVWIGAY